MARRVRWKSSLVGVKTAKWRPRRWFVALTVARGVGAPKERVVERVEVRALRLRRPLGIADAVAPDDVGLEAGGRLHHRAVSDRTVTACVGRVGARADGVARFLRNRLGTLVDFHAGTERGRDALGEVEVQVPRLDVFEDVRDVMAVPPRKYPSGH